MKNLLLSSPVDSIPPHGKQAYKLLSLFSTGRSFYRDELYDLIGGDVRAALGELSGKKYNYWLIDSHKGTYRDKLQKCYWLNERHLMGCWSSDKDARAIARKKNRDRSYHLCTKAVGRIGIVEKEMLEANLEYESRILKGQPKDD